MTSAPAAAGPKRVEVPPERLERWLRRWEAEHRSRSALIRPEAVTFQGEDGASARCQVPFPPLPEEAGDVVSRLVDHAGRERTVAVLPCRRGGHAAGIFVGSRLESSKVGSRLVHGRSAAGDGRSTASSAGARTRRVMPGRRRRARWRASWNPGATASTRWWSAATAQPSSPWRRTRV